jgi:heme/copper-type cytochrome/quinol oxidase subunit 2
MSPERLFKFGVAALLIAGAGGVGALLASPSAPPQTRRVDMKARQYAYDPPVLTVNKGDTVRVRIVSEDVVHGFYLEGYDIDAKVVPQSPYIELSHPSRPKDKPHKVEEILFVANRAGKFRYRCSHTCGTMHPFMNGELVVAPNRLFSAGLGGLTGLLLAGCVISLWNSRTWNRLSGPNETVTAGE